MIVIQAEALAEQDRLRFPENLWALPLLDLSNAEAKDVRQELSALLPLAEKDNTTVPDVSKQIEWD